ncbi:MAG: hypothetical protein ACHQ5A_11945 [Opitutales bacterium]
MVILGGVAALMTASQNLIINGPQTLVAIMDTISLATDKEAERQVLLDRYRPQKQIEDKSHGGFKPVGRESFSSDLDDEIPF